jgi:hypothetical protein
VALAFDIDCVELSLIGRHNGPILRRHRAEGLCRVSRRRASTLFNLSCWRGKKSADNRAHFSVFFLSSFFLVSSYNSTYAFGKLVSSSIKLIRQPQTDSNAHKDRPVSTAVLVYFLLGILLLAIGRFVPIVSQHSSPIGKRSSIPADHFEIASRTSSPSSTLGSQGPPLTLGRLWLRVGLLLWILGLRVELFRRVTIHNECAPAGYAVRLFFCVFDLKLKLLIVV